MFHPHFVWDMSKFIKISEEVMQNPNSRLVSTFEHFNVISVIKIHLVISSKICE